VTHPLLEDRRTGLTVESAYLECARIARREARNFYFAFLPLRRERRRALYAVYSFARLADDLADADRFEPAERLHHLEQLEERLEESLVGEPRGAVFTGLADAVRRYPIRAHVLRELIAGVGQDLHVQRYATWEDLYGYCYQVAGTVGLICAAVFEAQGPEADRYAVAQGLGMQLVNIMRDVREDAEAGRIYLPEELLLAYDVSEEGILKGEPGSGWLPLMQDVGRRARESLVEGSELLPLVAVDARICPALLRDLYERVLDTIEARQYDVFGNDIDISFLSKSGLLLTAWWKHRMRQ
jgi:phytoene synthase